MLFAKINLKIFYWLYTVFNDNFNKKFRITYLKALIKSYFCKNNPQVQMKTIQKLIIFSLLLSLSSCVSLKRASTFSKCEFRINKVESISLNNKNVKGKNSIADLSMNDISTLLASAVSGPLIMDMTLMVDIKNPNKSTAAMNRIDWILFIDNYEIMNGTSNQKIVLPPDNIVVTVPLEIKSNIKEVISNGGGMALLKMALNLSGVDSDPGRITLKAKPYIQIGSRDIAYPGYISIKTNFTSE